jgi:hypothetical protein
LPEKELFFAALQLKLRVFFQREASKKFVTETEK